MKSDWQRVKLGDCFEFLSGKAKPKEKGQYPIYGSNGLIGSAPDYMYEDAFVIGRVGAVGELHWCKEKFWASDNTIVARSIASALDNQFAYYLLKRANLKGDIHGSAQPLITKSGLRLIEISLPPLPTQRRIAAVLGALDDKIELNRKMNANLEAQAQALFKSWFVDFEPWGGKMPAGWKMGKLGEIAEVCYGKDHKALKDGPFPVYGSGGIMRYAERPLFEEESVLIPRKGSLNNIMYSPKPFWTVDTMFYTKTLMPNSTKYLFLFLHGKDMMSLNVGSAVPSMTTATLNQMELIVPDDVTLVRFEKNVKTFFELHEYNDRESRKLAELRDTLLPKLMSGLLRVDATEGQGELPVFAAEPLRRGEEVA